MNSYEAILSSASTKFSKLVKKPEKFLDPSPELFEEIKLLNKVLYDVGKLTEEPDTKTLPELYIQDFDEEQVWTGIQLQNAEKLQKWRSKFASLNLEGCNLLLGSRKKKSRTEKEIVEDDELEDQEFSEMELSDHDEDEDEEEVEVPSKDDDELDEMQDILNDPDFQNMSDSEGDDLPLFDDLSEDEKDGDEEGTYRAQEKKSTRSRVTEVDDKFFKLRDMEEFLEIEDRREEKKRSKKDEEDSEDEDDIDLFDDVGDDDEEIGAMGNQFFREEDENELLEEEIPKTGKKPAKDEITILLKNGKLVTGDEEEEEQHSEDENDDDEEDDEGEEEEEDENQKMDLLDDSDDESESEQIVESRHEKSQARLKEKIKKLEEKAIGDKPWQMGGEVAAPVRPENSLLSEHLEYEAGVRQAPVITEDVARKLEDIVKQRIKDKAWDDVVRRVKPIEDPQEYRKKLVLDQEKSKLSLAQVYEEEFLRVSQVKEKVPVPGLLDEDREETPEEVDQIKSAMRSLFSKLDTLTHFHYTPKQKSAEVKIVRNVPSIGIEEVAPVGASNADLLAPAEVVDKAKGELMTSGDKTVTDRKRERRQKKLKKKASIREREKREKEKANAGVESKISKEKALKNLEQAEKQGKVKTIKEKDKNSSLKSSTAFFSMLQDEVKTHVKEKSSKKKKLKEGKVSLSALRL